MDEVNLHLVLLGVWCPTRSNKTSATKVSLEARAPTAQTNLSILNSPICTSTVNGLVVLHHASLIFLRGLGTSQCWPRAATRSTALAFFVHSFLRASSWRGPGGSTSAAITILQGSRCHYRYACCWILLSPELSLFPLGPRELSSFPLGPRSFWQVSGH